MVDSRSATDGVRRRRTCNECRRRFTTYEKAGAAKVKVQKRDGTSQPFDPDKIARALARVGRGRPALGAAATSRLARALEAELLDEGMKQIRSGEIVERLLRLVRPVDQIAHDRLQANYLDESGTLRTEPAVGGEADGQLGLFRDDDD